ncbi:hypothetical protein ACEZ3G_02740 [Maribacter algicola]|uniref:Uncharacterized protein n=1 Tax=Meishania litoralis TaxID=3434685 RepID=A0ACC7LGR5_9FLAO
MKKSFVLFVLFILPLVVYLFFASGVNNFGKLATLTEKVNGLNGRPSSITLNDKITILGFLGNDLDNKKGHAFNLNQKIYKRFYEFDDFQFVMVVPEGVEEKTVGLRKELGALSDTGKWNFIFMQEQDIAELFGSLNTNLSLDESLSTPYVFIIDKDRNLRGRDDDEDVGTKYGFDATSVADLNNKMVDDVKIILAEYRLALKKNTTRKLMQGER